MILLPYLHPLKNRSSELIAKKHCPNKTKPNGDKGTKLLQLQAEQPLWYKADLFDRSWQVMCHGGLFKSYHACQNSHGDTSAFKVEL